jgi:hypothetical protein
MILMFPLLINSLSCLLIIEGQPLMTRGRGRFGSSSLREPTLSSPSHFCKATVHAFNHLIVNVEPWFLIILKMNWRKLLTITSLSRIRVLLSKAIGKTFAKDESTLDNLILSTGSIESFNLYLSLKFKINFILFIFVN